MIDDKLHFAISQYVDGMLSAEEAARIADLAARDADVMALIEEYRRLDGMLRQSAAAPEIDWSEMAGRISAAIDAGAERIAIPITEAKPSWNWLRPLAVAAGLLICASLALVAWLAGQGKGASSGGRGEGYAIVTVLTPEAVPNSSDVEVRIGQASQQGVLIAMGAEYADLTSRGQSRVLISSLPVQPLPDDEFVLLQ